MAAAVLARGAAVDDLRALVVRRGAGPPTTLGAAVGNGPAVITFWATWCVPCQAEVPVLRGAAARWREAGLRVLGVAVDQDAPDRVARAAADWGIDYEVWWAPGSERPRLERLLPRGLPATFLVGRHGVERLDRLVTEADLGRRVPPLLEAAPPAQPVD